MPEREGFTPGPWTIEADDGGYVAISGPAGSWSRFARAVVKMDGDAFDNPEGVANARLIASAPALLAALTAIVNSTDYGADDERPLMQAARAAIKSATGDDHAP